MAAPLQGAPQRHHFQAALQGSRHNPVAGGVAAWHQPVGASPTGATSNREKAGTARTVFWLLPDGELSGAPQRQTGTGTRSSLPLPSWRTNGSQRFALDCRMPAVRLCRSATCTVLRDSQGEPRKRRGATPSGRHARYFGCCLTLPITGPRKPAKPAGEGPVDGRVRPHTFGRTLRQPRLRSEEVIQPCG